MSIRAPDICDADELVARAALCATRCARQAECSAGSPARRDQPRYIDAGFFRVLQPRRFGGLELGLEAFLRIAIELSRGCPSSGWVHGLTAGHAHTVTVWPEQGQVSSSATATSAARSPTSRPRPCEPMAGTASTAGETTRRAATSRRTSSAGSRSTASRAPAGRPSPRGVLDRRQLGHAGHARDRVAAWWSGPFVPEHWTVASPNPGARGRAARARRARTRSTARARSCRCSSPSRGGGCRHRPGCDRPLRRDPPDPAPVQPQDPLRREVVFQRDLGQATALVTPGVPRS